MKNAAWEILKKLRIEANYYKIFFRLKDNFHKFTSIIFIRKNLFYLRNGCKRFP